MYVHVHDYAVTARLIPHYWPIVMMNQWMLYLSPIIGSAAIVLVAAMCICGQSRTPSEPDDEPNPDQIVVDDFVRWAAEDFLPIRNNEPLPRE
ncbi:hypothetical protein BDF22DRAFT_745274 [Syncephalis plumigaleata]|nr:hypothetical protein BDF22DRAFT_745274 [Syncephalis plumigaleata]